MSQTNNIHIEGNLTADPELRFTRAGDAVANFRVAQTDGRVVNGERLEHTEYISVVAWRTLGENAAMSLSKGSRVIVTGKLRQRKANVNGEDRYYTEIHADNVSVSLRWATVGEIERSVASAAPALEPAGAPAGGTDEVIYGDEEPF